MVGNKMVGTEWGRPTPVAGGWIEGQKEKAQVRKEGSPQLPSEDQSGAAPMLLHAPMSMPPPHPHIQFSLMLREETRDGHQLSPNHPDGDQILDL